MTTDVAVIIVYGCMLFIGATFWYFASKDL